MLVKFRSFTNNLQKKLKNTMQLAVTVLGSHQSRFMAEILPAIRDCKCHILEIRSSCIGQSTAAYLLIQGNWNQIAKFEGILDLIQKRLEIKVQTLRTESKEKVKECLPYSLETISLDNENIIESIATFLLDHEIEIEEVTGSSYQAPYLQTAVFSSKFIVLIPASVSLLTLREEFMDFCDQLNIDAILEPVKR
ncbi:MAG: glycine cleavage system transcriptional repressor [Methylococcaceae bacterium NSP1-2]|nr:MAG: glycine cleavage system transcriptional repressor [Methylococcaceae bacterium NSP1-2]